LYKICYVLECVQGSSEVLLCPFCVLYIALTVYLLSFAWSLKANTPTTLMTFSSDVEL
jgi:hypothetical protein